MSKRKIVGIELLDNWKSLNAGLTKDLTEEQLQTLIAHEREHSNRVQFLLRLYGRFNTLRTVRERRELLTE